MKTLIILVAVLALAFCQVQYYNIGNECSPLSCQNSDYGFNNSTYLNYTCPKSRQQGANLIPFLDTYVFSFISNESDSNISIPLTLNEYPSDYGIQYFANLNNNGHFFIIFNCTYPSSRNSTSLCNNHELVGSKIYNNSFNNTCAFGIDSHRSSNLRKEIPLDFESSF